MGKIASRARTEGKGGMINPASPLLLLARSFRTKFVLGVVLWIAASRDKEYGVTR